jgi:hypothetical protein
MVAEVFADGFGGFAGDLRFRAGGRIVHPVEQRARTGAAVVPRLVGEVVHQVVTVDLELVAELVARLHVSGHRVVDDLMVVADDVKDVLGHLLELGMWWAAVFPRPVAGDIERRIVGSPLRIFHHVRDLVHQAAVEIGVMLEVAGGVAASGDVSDLLQVLMLLNTRRIDGRLHAVGQLVEPALDHLVALQGTVDRLGLRELELGVAHQLPRVGHDALGAFVGGFL